jgi:hypothetical protein
MAGPLRYGLAAHVVFTPTGDEALLLQLTTEKMFTLNATGARTVQLITDGLGIDAVIETLAGEYGADRADVERDTLALVDALVEGGLLEELPAGTGR